MASAPSPFDYCWDDSALIHGKRALVEAKSVVCVTGADWHRVRYNLWSHPNAPQDIKTKWIICWHGLARNAHDFDKLAQYIVKEISHAKVVVVDTPGRGESEWISNHSFYNLQTYAIVASNILTSIGNPEEIDWIGISMGGLLGMLLSAAAKNCPIKHLVLIDIGPFVSKNALERIGSYLGKDISWNSIEEAKEYFKKTYSQFGPLEDSDWNEMAQYLTKFVENEKNEVSKEMESNSSPSGGSYRLHYDPGIAYPYNAQPITDMNLWAVWDMIKTSVMVVHGAMSDVLTKETVEEMKSRGPKLEKILTFENCGHTPHFNSLQKSIDIIHFIQSKKDQ